MDSADAHGLVLDRFSTAAPELSNGFAEHTPMGSDALLALEIDPDQVVVWATRHEPRPFEDPDRRAEIDMYRRRIDELGWVAALREVAGALVGQLDAHLFHGLIRTAHAVRAIERREDPGTLNELAAGLACWSRWAADAPPSTTPAGESGSDSTDWHPAILDVARRGAAAFVAHRSIFTLHAVTAPMAYLLLAPHLDEASHRGALDVFSRTHARHPASSPELAELPRPLFDGLLERWDAHPAKLVEAAWRGYQATRDAAFAAAIQAMLAE